MKKVTKKGLVGTELKLFRELQKKCTHPSESILYAKIIKDHYNYHTHICKKCGQFI
jgi:hypothetical protein